MSECLITIKVGSRRLNSCPTISAYLHAVNYSISQQPINLSNQRWMDTGRVHRHPSDGKTVIMNELLLRNAEVVASNLLFNQPIDSQLWKLLRLYGMAPNPCLSTSPALLLWWIFNDHINNRTENDFSSVRVWYNVENIQNTNFM